MTRMPWTRKLAVQFNRPFKRQNWTTLRILGVSAALIVSLLPAALVASSPASANTSAVACLGANGLGYSQGNTPTNLMAGKLTIPGFGVTNIGTGNIDFVALSKGRNPTWNLWFHSLKWIEPLIASYAAGQNGSGAYLNRASAIAADWAATYPEKTPAVPPAWDGQATSLRAETLSCLAKYDSSQWLDDAIQAHGRHLASARNYAGEWNHGLEQNIALLTIGCLKDDQGWIDLARSRTHQELVSTIDSQGVFNEQAPGYGPWTITRWWTFDDALRQCGLPQLPDLDSRLSKFATFLAYSTQPDGTLVQIGDTFATPIRSDVAAAYPAARFAASKGRYGTTPGASNVVYNAGYVFARSAWGSQNTFANQSYFTMRFGPMRFAHGHFDHTSVTWFARGHKILVDAGHVGYPNSAYRKWIISAEAANVLTVPGVPLRTYGTSKLVRSSVGTTSKFYEVTDNTAASGGAYQGLSRTRGVLLMDRTQAMVVYDRVSTAKLRHMYKTKAKVRVRLWHLDPAFRVKSVSTSAVVAVAGKTQVTVLQVPFPGQKLAKGSQTVARGKSSPIQGWVSTAQNKRVAAATVQQRSTASKMVSIIVPSAAGKRVTAKIVATGHGRYRIDIRIGSTVTHVRVSANGQLHL